MNELVIFDLDDTLVESEKWKIRAYELALTRFKIPFNKENYVQFWIKEGKGLSYFLKKLVFVFLKI
ncbi:NIF family HAD-type phosphatase [Nanoarchaeota archaeon]